MTGIMSQPEKLPSQARAAMRMPTRSLSAMRVEHAAEGRNTDSRRGRESHRPNRCEPRPHRERGATMRRPVSPVHHQPDDQEDRRDARHGDDDSG